MRFLSIFLLLACASLAPAQAVDTTRTYDLDAVVVTADRAVGALAASTAAVSVIETETLRKLPVAGLQDVLETLPGFAFLNVDGQRENPQATIRGFYGGGETEYVVILLDGKPLNGLAQGLPDWQSVPLLGIERVEVLRGASSALYGDAAIGGVINLVTNGQNLETTTAQLTAGSFGLVTGEFSQRADRYTVYGGIRRLGGYRESSDRQYARIGASYDVLRSATRRLTASTLHSLRNYDDPGALTGEQVEADRRQQALPFRFDGLDERTHRIGLDGRQTTAWGKARVAFAADYRAADLLRTLPLAATFFDTKRRETEAGRLFASVQTEFGNLPLGGRFIVGVDGTLGQLDSEYRLVNLGPPEAYLGELDPESGEIDRDGNATRRALAGFAQLDLNPADAIRITLGARADGLSDRYTPDVPSDGETLSTDNSAISPKVGINVRYAQTATQLGRLYVSASRSFKAPTLDQLYDQRTYFFSPEIPPITISNGELKPQTGVGIEAGAYHRVELSRDVAVEASVSAYRIDMENELDFSFEILRFVNVAESRHDGIEVGLKAYGPRGLSVFGNWTRQDVTFANGPNEGNAVKAIPRDFFSGGVTGEIARGVFGSLLVTSAQTIFLDDANVVRLPDYTVANLRLGYRIGGAELLLNLYNVLDASYSATGFPDPAGSDVAFFYPAAGRTFEAGLRLQLR